MRDTQQPAFISSFLFSTLLMTSAHTIAIAACGSLRLDEIESREECETEEAKKKMFNKKNVIKNRVCLSWERDKVSDEAYIYDVAGHDEQHKKNAFA